jgi:hypothetical protein
MRIGFETTEDACGRRAVRPAGVTRTGTTGRRGPVSREDETAGQVPDMCWEEHLSSTERNPVPSYRSWLSGIRVGAAASALAIGAAALAAPSASAANMPAATPGGWRTVPGPAIAAGASANLTALAMAGPSLGWTAGFTLADPNAPFEPLLAAWNGRRWRAIPVHLAKGISGRLDGLAAASADDAWAVGTADVSDDSLQPLFLHWNGRQWARVPGASVPGFGYVSMYGVAIHSATDAWAVGEAESTTKPVLRPVIGHWNGRR